MKRESIFLASIAAIAITVSAGPASAERDPAYAAARAAGKIGEKPDGYLGVVGNQGSDIEALVRDINIKRKASYTAMVKNDNATIEQFAFSIGCNLVAQTAPGEKYQAPDGSWHTRGSTPPIRDSRCP